MKVLQVFFGVLLFLLSGCFIQNNAVDATQIFLLKSNNENFQKHFTNTGKILKIMPANSPLYLNSKNIIYTDKNVTNAYALHFWADTPSNLYHLLLIQKFEQSGIFKAVLSQKSLLEPDFLLESRLNAFEQIIDEKQNYALISVSVNFIESKSNMIIAHKNFVLKEKISQLNPMSMFKAFDKALNSLAVEIILWVDSLLEQK